MSIVFFVASNAYRDVVGTKLGTSFVSGDKDYACSIDGLSNQTVMYTYKGFGHYFLHLLYLPTLMTAGSVGKIAKVRFVVRVHSQVVVGLLTSTRRLSIMKRNPTTS